MEQIDFIIGGPFYEMVQSYKLAINGLVTFRPEMKPCLDNLYQAFGGKVVGLHSHTLGDLRIDPYENMLHIQQGSINLGQVTNNLLYMLLNISYESVKDRMDKNNPIHEFFRHVRNAASHGGKWHFTGNAPVNPAEWRGRVLNQSMNGQPLFTNNLSDGDFIILLMDVEQTL